MEKNGNVITREDGEVYFVLHLVFNESGLFLFGLTGFRLCLVFDSLRLRIESNKIWSIIVAVQHQKGNKTLLLKLWIIG